MLAFNIVKALTGYWQIIIILYILKVNSNHKAFLQERLLFHVQLQNCRNSIVTIESSWIKSIFILTDIVIWLLLYSLKKWTFIFKNR